MMKSSKMAIPIAPVPFPLAAFCLAETDADRVSASCYRRPEDLGIAALRPMT